MSHLKNFFNEEIIPDDDFCSCAGVLSEARIVDFDGTLSSFGGSEIKISFTF